jgi:endoglucanase
MNNSAIRALRTTALTFLLFWFGCNVCAAGYSVITGKIYDASGQEVQIRGISHQGFNSTILQPQFLWSMGWKEQIAQMKSLGFNAIRVPFVPDTLYNTTPVDQLSYVDPGKNPEFIGKTPLQALDLWMAEADRQGMYILLDFHSVSKLRQYPTWFVSNPADFNLIYNQQAYTKDNWLRDLAFVATRYAALPHFFAIDVYNEPNGVVRWSAGDPFMTDSNNFWKPAVEAAANAILAANPNLLVFVQGVSGNFDGIEKNLVINWGEDFQPQSYQPLNIPTNKLVLSPHTYGPDVAMLPSFSDPAYPANLTTDWDTLFGQFSPAFAVVPGEYGGRFGQGGQGVKDVQWQSAFVDYLIKKDMHNSFYWCYTPNSSDTGGILDDNLNVRTDKMELLKRLWATSAAPAPPPTPTPTPTPTPSPVPSPTPTPGPDPMPAPAPAPDPIVDVSPAPAPTTGEAVVTARAPLRTSGGGGFDVILLLSLGLVVLWRARAQSAADKVQLDSLERRYVRRNATRIFRF